MYRRIFVGSLLAAGGALKASAMCGSRKRTQDHGRVSELQGEITAVYSNRLDLSAGSRIVTVLLARNISIHSAGAELSPEALKPGEWIVIGGTPLASGEWVANEIRMGNSGPGSSPHSEGAPSGHQH